jgi:hypothetical protein
MQILGRKKKVLNSVVVSDITGDEPDDNQPKKYNE